MHGPYASAYDPFDQCVFFLPEMTLGTLLRFVLLAAVISTAACVVMLVLRSPCLDIGGFVVPARGGLVAVDNGAQADDPSKAAAETTKDNDELSKVLRGAAMEDLHNTIIMTFTNEAFAAPGSLMDLFLESFHTGVGTEPLLKHLVIVAADDKAFVRCRQVHPHCYALDMGSTNFTSEQEFMAKDYLDMMWRRNRFQARVLALGYSFVFTDVDIIWFRNPLLRIPVAAELAMSADMFLGHNPYDLRKRANGGFVYAKASARMSAFFDDWYEARKEFPGKNEQDLFDKLKWKMSAAHNVTTLFLDTDFVGGFCERSKARDFYQLCTYHGNCLRGHKQKMERLKGVMDEWKQFKKQHTDA